MIVEIEKKIPLIFPCQVLHFFPDRIRSLMTTIDSQNGSNMLWFYAKFNKLQCIILEWPEKWWKIGEVNALLTLENLEFH